MIRIWGKTGIEELEQNFNTKIQKNVSLFTVRNADLHKLENI